MFPAIALVVLILWQAIAARAAGGGIFKNLWRVPEILFALPFGLAAFALSGEWWLGLLGAVWSFLWMETGHGTAFWMGYQPKDAQSGRKQFLSPVVDAVTRAAGRPLGGVFYCWVFMGLKGFLIALPCGWWAFLLAFLWPAYYQIGRELQVKGWVKDGAVCEWLSGGAAGLVVWAALFA